MLEHARPTPICVVGARLRLHVFFWCVCRLPKSQQCVDRLQCMYSIAVLWTPVVVSILPDHYVPVPVFICLGSLRVVCQVCLVYTVFFANYKEMYFYCRKPTQRKAYSLSC